MKSIYFFLLSFMIITLIKGQNVFYEPCGSEIGMELKLQDSAFRNNLFIIEEELKKWIENNQGYISSPKAVITIPVVIHIVLKAADQSKVPDSRVFEQLEILNRDFAGLNPHPMYSFPQSLKSNTEIQFCLAQTNKDGTSLTSGINRFNTEWDHFYYDSPADKHAVKHESAPSDPAQGVNQWNRNQYFNIWVCDFLNNPTSQQPVAFGTFPFSGGFDDNFGVVINFNWFGKTNNPNWGHGSTLSHEIGHCLGLWHIWRVNNDCTLDDECNDTPLQNSPNYTKPNFPKISCSNGPKGDMFINFMDYTDDEVRSNFTPNQKARMLGYLAGVLNPLTTSNVCNPPTNICDKPIGLSASVIGPTSVTLTWNVVTGATNYKILYGTDTDISLWTEVTSTTNTKILSGLTESTTYGFMVKAECPGGYGNYSLPYYFTTDKDCLGDLNIWLGLTSDWFSFSNWSLGLSPMQWHNVLITAKPNDPIINGDIAEVCNLDVANNVILRIEPTGGLTVHGIATIDGFLYITSNNTGSSGSFIDNGLAGSGKFQFDRVLINSEGTEQTGWHLISSPVKNTVTGDFVGYWVTEWYEIESKYFHIDPYTIPCNVNGNSTLVVSIDVMQGYAAKRDISYPPCNPCIPPTEEIVELGGDKLSTYPGYGHIPPSPTNPAAISNVNTGTISFPFTKSDFDRNDLNGVNVKNWNLLGNPYPSSIECASIIWPTSGLDNSIYFWDEAAKTYKSWAGGAGEPQIPPTQGFFVKATGNGTLTFNNSMRTHTGASKFYKSNIQYLLELGCSGNGYEDVTYIRFLNEASIDFDSKWDAYKLFSDAIEVPQIYTKTIETDLSINTLTAVNDVPLFMKAGLSGYYSINANEINDLKNVYLEDKKTGIMFVLTNNEPYKFYYSQGDEPDRFVVHFRDISISNQEGGFVIYSSQGNIMVYNINNQQGDVYVYNVVGQLLGSVSLQDGINNITLDDTQGYYIVNVRTNENVVNKKVYIH